MARRILAAFYAAALAAAVSGPAHAEFGVGADAATRYIWRGLSLDDSFVIQPYLSYATEAGIEVGAWSSWSLTASGANENDLYVSYSAGPVSITLSDYYFPNGEGTEFFEFGEIKTPVLDDGGEPELDDGGNPVTESSWNHQFEAMASFASGPLSLTGALIFHGAEGMPVYAEAGYEFLSGDDVSAGLFAGLGTESFYTSSGDPAVVNVGLGVSMGDYSAQYILNPDTEQSYLVLMKGL